MIAIHIHGTGALAEPSGIVVPVMAQSRLPPTIGYGLLWEGARYKQLGRSEVAPSRDATSAGMPKSINNAYYL
jgi:hypothetical protein